RRAAGGPEPGRFESRCRFVRSRQCSVGSAVCEEKKRATTERRRYSPAMIQGAGPRIERREQSVRFLEIANRDACLDHVRHERPVARLVDLQLVEQPRETVAYVVGHGRPAAREGKESKEP